MTETPVVFMFVGRPTVEKTEIAKHFAGKHKHIYIEVDAFETNAIEGCDYAVNGRGKRVAYRHAADNLKLGTGIVANSNIEAMLVEEEWENVATLARAHVVYIEVVGQYASLTPHFEDPMSFRAFDQTAMADIQASIALEVSNSTKNFIRIMARKRPYTECVAELDKRIQSLLLHLRPYEE